MGRLVVLTDQPIALGFALAGVEVLRPDADVTVRAQLEKLLDDSSVGLVAVGAELMAGVDEPTRQRAERSLRPVVVTLPHGSPVRDTGADDPRARLQALLRHAIGVDLTFPEKGGS